MARIAGIDLPRNKRGEIGLTYIFGIGRSSSRKILANAGVDMNTKVGEWDDEQLNAIRKLITDEFRVEGELRSEVQLNIKRLMDIGCYRGQRHRKGLPLRGQAYQEQFAYPQRQAQDRGQQEKGHQVIPNQPRIIHGKINQSRQKACGPCGCHRTGACSLHV
jgi:30S ribosomal protein S13